MRKRRDAADETYAPSASVGGWHVYTLHDPDTGETMYVGCSGRLRGRWHLHLSAARRGEEHAPPVVHWVAGLLADGKLPVMRIVTRCESEEAANILESQKIREMMGAGIRLLNVLGTRDKRALPPQCRRCGGEHRARNCPQRPPTNAEICAQRHARLAAEGLCIWCAKPTSGHSRCDACRDGERMRNRMKKEAA